MNGVRRTVWLSAIVLLACGLAAAEAELQPNQPSSASSGGVRVYSSNGYFVKASNSNDYAVYYSYTYVVKKYDKSNACVSEEETSETDKVLQANESRELFTAPVDPKREFTYWVKVTSVTDVKKKDRP